ncbi:hypothetical protein ACHAXS_005555, partial [Conticribra weissflogii]
FPSSSFEQCHNLSHERQTRFCETFHDAAQTYGGVNIFALRDDRGCIEIDEISNKRVKFSIASMQSEMSFSLSATFSNSLSSADNSSATDSLAFISI